MAPLFSVNGGFSDAPESVLFRCSGQKLAGLRSQLILELDAGHCDRVKVTCSNHTVTESLKWKGTFKDMTTSTVTLLGPVTSSTRLHGAVV